MVAGISLGAGASASLLVQDGGPSLVELHDEVMEAIVSKEKLVLWDKEEVSTALHRPARGD